MSHDTSDPPLEPPHPDVPRPLDPPMEHPSPADVANVAPPRDPRSVTTSGDELNLLLPESLETIDPDPFLGEYSPESSPSPESIDDSPVADFAHDEPPSESFDAVAVLNAFTEPSPIEPITSEPVAPGLGAPESDRAAVVDRYRKPEGKHGDTVGASSSEAGANSSMTVEVGPHLPGFDEFPAESSAEGGSFDAFSAVDLSAPTSSKKSSQADEDDEEEPEHEIASSRPSVLRLLLPSYASAVTVALIWVLLSGRRLREKDDVEIVPPTDTRADPGLRADQSRKIVPPRPVAADHVATLGKTIRLGSLEATPVSITTGKVRLKRSISTLEYQDGGVDALKLALHLKNVGTDTIYAPLDEAFLRGRGPETLDTFIETEDGGAIAMFPLAVTSEWSIDGQEFKELRPGESFDAVIVSDTQTASRLTSELTWRIRLRTGLNETETLGVRFHKAEIQQGS